jgi:hypothetical protein
VTKFKVQYSADNANWDYVQNGRVSFSWNMKQDL